MEISSKISEKYELLQHEFLKDTGCDSLLLVHKKTGARVALLPSDDDNKVFYIGFRTPPKDSTGVAQGFPGQGPFYRTGQGIAQHISQRHDLSRQDSVSCGKLQRHGF